MAFADPQSVTVSGSTINMPRISSGVNQGAFQTAGGAYKLSVSSAYGNRTRQTVRLDFTKTAADPLLSGTNNYYSMSTYLVVDTPKVGFTVTEAKAIVDALVLYLTNGTGARVTQLLGGEN